MVLKRASKVSAISSALVILSLLMPAAAMDVDPQLDSGYRLLYNLDFSHAEREFSSWEQQHGDDPLGPASEAAGILFSEFQRLGVLEAQFYENDSAFQGRKKLSADPVARARFDAALQRAESLARARMAKDPKDLDGLFALTLSSGLKADYAALIEKRNMESLHRSREATAWADQLLAVHPDCYDAHLAGGISRYLIGSMVAPVRWFLGLRGVKGDKQAGIAELQLTAERGHYLAPFARILLAIAYVREKDKPRAREMLVSLRKDFPENPLFVREIARLDSGK
ncbi:MAG TPA: hypothetical protein VEV41_03590 [Terriglobales bacterium]|nr:hypothetical protein [Terriglobales bacterium]